MVKTADKNDDGPDLGASEYDKGVEDRLEAESKDQEELSEGVLRMGGVVVTGVDGPIGSRGDLGVGLQTTYPGISARFGTTDAAVALRRAKSLPETGIIAQSSNSWTAQSAAGFTPSNATQVPGMTFTSEELPDAAVVLAAKYGAHTIPAGVVVNPPDSRAMLQDSTSSSQEGGDLGTAPKRTRTGPAGPV